MQTRESKIYNIIGHIIMIIMSLTALVPIVLMIISSFTDNASLVNNGYSYYPEKWSLFAYEWLFASNRTAIFRAYGMSFILTGIGVIIALSITTLLAYGLSKKDLPFRKIITFYVFFTMLFNGGLVPTYINYTQVFKIKDTFAGLLVPSLLMNAFNVMLMKSYFTSNIPNEILEAAYIDGAGELKTMFRVALPMAKPILATIGLFVGIGYWNDWQNGYIYLVKNTDLYTIQNLLNRLMQNIQALSQNATNLSTAGQGLAQMPTSSVRMAMATLGIIPIVVVYPFVQKFFVKGITLGGVKG